MQHVAVDVVGPQMFEGTRYRLRNLRRKVGCGIVRQAVVLSALIREFRLQKKILSSDYSGKISGGQSLTYPGFKIMPPLIGRIDGAKS